MSRRSMPSDLPEGGTGLTDKDMRRHDNYGACEVRILSASSPNLNLSEENRNGRITRANFLLAIRIADSCFGSSRFVAPSSIGKTRQRRFRAGYEIPPALLLSCFWFV